MRVASDVSSHDSSSCSSAQFSTPIVVLLAVRLSSALLVFGRLAGGIAPLTDEPLSVLLRFTGDVFAADAASAFPCSDLLRLLPVAALSALCLVSTLADRVVPRLVPLVLRFCSCPELRAGALDDALDLDASLGGDAPWCDQ